MKDSSIGSSDPILWRPHVIADAGYDTEALRRFIAGDLRATAQIKRNRSRAGSRPLDRALYGERHLVECFFNRIKRFRRIALRCEKTVASFKAFVDLACAMAWIPLVAVRSDNGGHLS